MKYKCIAKCFVEDSIIMSPGDVIVIEGDQFYNISTGVDYRNVPDMERLKACLEVFSDELIEGVVPVIRPVTDVERFQKITEKMVDIFHRKNHDYGNSFELSLNEEGLAASRIRMGDKWNRFKKLSKGVGPEVLDESLRDTLIDLANYSIMTVMWLDKQKCDSDER